LKQQEKHKIAITDNNPIVVEGFISLFKNSTNNEVVGIAHDGDDLRSLLAKTRIDILFLDLKLPATNIYRLIKDLVVDFPHVKIIAFCNYTMPKLVQDVMEFGAHAYLSKTASLSEILNTIERVHKEERFISTSVYQKNQKPKPGENDFSIELADDFVRFSELTEREMDIVILLSRGYTNKEMAEKLFISKYTIETHRKNVMKKLKLKTSGQLVYFAVQQGLV